MDKIEEVLTRGVANIIPGKQVLKDVLTSGRKINIYLGIDPTAPRIHLGHAVSIRKLQNFVDLGHKVTFLIGNFTSLIGDTSDKDSERPILTEKEIEQNFQTYKEQAEKLLDFSKVHIVRNRDWLNTLTFAEIVRLTQNFSVNDFISRELIRKRLDEGKRVRLDEVLYPIMQGYDSYFMDTDLQIGGTDQTFNMQAGRTLQKVMRNKESFVLSTVFLTGTDGRKMSKSWGNAIWISDSAEDMFAKVMAVRDDLLLEYFLLATNVPLHQVEAIKERLQSGANPMEIKKELAFIIVEELHDKTAAVAAQEKFEKTVQNRELPEEIPVVIIPETLQSEIAIADVLSTLGLVESKSEAKRLVDQGGVEIDGQKVTNTNEIISVKDDMIIKVGKRRIVKLTTTK